MNQIDEALQNNQPYEDLVEKLEIEVVDNFNEEHPIYKETVEFINDLYESQEERSLKKIRFKTVNINEVFRQGDTWYKKVRPNSFVDVITGKQNYVPYDSGDFYVTIDESDRFGEIRFKLVNEDIPVNSVGTPPGDVAGVSDNDPPIHFAKKRVFEVDDDTFHKCKLGKRKYLRWDKYVTPDTNWGKEIKEYAQKNPKEPVIIRHHKSKVMMYLRR